MQSEYNAENCLPQELKRLKNILLSQMTVGSEGKILSVNASGEIRRRLLDMGLVKGVKIKVIRVAPLGDPIVIKLKGFYLSLRLREARHIEVALKGYVDDVDIIMGTFSKALGSFGAYVAANN